MKQTAARDVHHIQRVPAADVCVKAFSTPDLLINAID